MTIARLHTPTFFKLLAIFAAIFVAGIIVPSGLMASQAERALAELQAFDMSRALVIQGSLPAGASITITNRPTGRVEDFLMSNDSVEKLRLIPGVEALHEYRESKREMQSADGMIRDANLLIIPPGFLVAHHLGNGDAEVDLANNCLVLDTEQSTLWNLRPEEAIKIAPNREVRRKIEAMRATYGANVHIDDGRFENRFCTHRLTLPRGLSAFEGAIFAAADHPALRDRGYFPKPMLWLSISADANPDITYQRIETFLQNSAQPSNPQLKLQVARFGEYATKGLGSTQVLAWRQRLRWAAWGCGLALISTLLLLRWGALRREVALRQALGQERLICLIRTSTPYIGALGMGSLLGFAFSFICARIGFGIPVGTLIPEAGYMSLVLATTLVLFGIALKLACREAPMRVLARGAR